MKIIDLLNKIANGEELPEIISYMGQRFKLRDNAFYNEVDGGFELRDYYSSKDLNNEVEVIEEKKIPEKIEEKEIEVSMAIGEQICANKINEILDYLKSKGE